MIRLASRLGIVIGFLAAPAWTQPVINEIHYAPADKTLGVEFVELANPTAADIALGGWSLAGAVSFTFPAGCVLPAGGFVVAAQDPDAVQRVFPLSLVNPEAVVGPWGGRLSNEGETVVLMDAGGRRADAVDYRMGFPWPTVGGEGVSPGTELSIQLLNPALANDLGGHWRVAGPTPGFPNGRVATDNAPPAVRRVRTEPESPRSGLPVLVTARVTDPEGVAAVTLAYQVVEPGHYVHKLDTEFEMAWMDLPMRDDGREGDAEGGDGLYTVQIPGTVQRHRRLVRYRITAEDETGVRVRVPYADDPQPNFAYFVYDGVPAWTGAVRPGVDDPVVYESAVMTTLPIYHLLSKRVDVEAATWLEKYGGSDYRWMGTLVVDGRVYDHIRYRARGGVWRYAMGKNMWKFDFNRGHRLEARDDYGRRYPVGWDKLNLSACIQQGSFGHRGEQGMFEAAGFRLFNLMGLPAPRTHWLTLRIIDEAAETGQTQYDGDLWGLYLAIEQMDGRFLDAHDLPDGNLYKVEKHDIEEKHASNIGPAGPTDFSDFYRFRDGYRGGADPGEDWWREQVNLEHYYDYRCVVEGIHHGDIGYGKNYYFYFHPDTGRVSQLAWDLDLTWAENMYGNGQDPFLKEGAIFSHPALTVAYQNRLREFVDLLYNPDQAWQLIDALAAVIDDPNGGPSPVDVDRAMWDYHWVMGPDAYPTYLSREASAKAGQGKFYEAAASRDFPGMVQLMKDYILDVTARPRNWHGQAGVSLLDLMRDPDTPRRPVIRYTGDADFAANDLHFAVNDFADPQGPETFAALAWRLGEVEPFSVAAELPTVGDGGGPRVLLDEASVWSYLKGRAEPAGAPGAWRALDYDQTQDDWRSGTAPLGYGESFVVTVLDDMRKNYTTVYLRIPFAVADPEVVDTLALEARYDDGFAAWINGVPVHAQNVTGFELTHDARTPKNQEQSAFRRFDLDLPAGLLRAGQNLLAVHLVNRSRTSSDCFFDARLVVPAPVPTVAVPPGDRPVVRGRPGHYEVETLWASGSVTDFAPTVQIPPARVEPGHCYRVRCRMQDTSGRWSHWSAPVQFVVAPPRLRGLWADLRVTELMYHPSPAPPGEVWETEDFEFIELRNVGLRSLALGGLRWERGVSFDFADAAVPELAPGAAGLLVRNAEAFAARYGPAAAAAVLGVYTGKLSNGGERLTLADDFAGVLLDFEFRDDWYPSTDGQGHSLVLRDMQAAPETLSAASAWRASAAPQGTPGL